MKTAVAGLITLLNSSTQFVMADLITITLKSGTVLRYTSADIPIAWGGNNFSVFPFKRGRTRTVIGVEIDNMDLSLYAGIGDLISGIPFPQFAQNGGFDGADVKLERLYLSDWSTPVGALVMFSGRVSDVTPSRTEIRMMIKSDLELLNIKMPRNLYQPGCSYMLFDAGCGLNKASYANATTVQAGSTKTSILMGLGNAVGYFDRGTVTFNNGQNAGVTRTVKAHTSGQLALALALPYNPAAGDSITVYPGCDKQVNTCGAYELSLASTLIEGREAKFTVNTTTDVITATAYIGGPIPNFVNGDRVTVRTVSWALPSPLVAGTGYYIIESNGTTFKLAATKDGVAIDITTSGGTNMAIRTSRYQLSSSGSRYQNDNPVTVRNTGGALPSPLAGSTTYYIVGADDDGFSLSATKGGEAIAITSAGTGSHYIKAVDKFNNITRFRGFPFIPAPETAY